ncbi:MAG: hypothetical protein IJ746_02375 [Ruminococcus sp.]|nr:hypothetical protein [Ruminococcus sp.]
MTERLKEIILTPPAAALLGALCGLGARYAEYKDILFEDVTSRLMAWVFICVLVTLLCSAKKQAVIFVSFFAVPMLLANFGLWYYLTKTTGYEQFSVLRLVCWIAFGLLSPLFASGVYMTKSHSLFAILMRPATVLLPVIVTLIAFRSICIADVVFTLALAYLMYVKKLGRTDE